MNIIDAIICFLNDFFSFVIHNGICSQSEMFQSGVYLQ